MRSALSLSLYSTVGAIAWYAAMPIFRIVGGKGKRHNLYQGRLGMVPHHIAAKSPWDVWIHAVSVGETGVASAIVDELDKIRPDLKILISSTTPAGYYHAQKLLGHRCGIIVSPLDFPQAVSRAAEAIRPGIYAPIETELWPSTINEMYKRGTRLALLNGRISDRSFPRYLKIRWVTSALLKRFSIVCASSPVSSERLISLGAHRKKMVITGNAKYQALINRPDGERAADISRLLDIPAGTPVLVAGSIRSGDEEHLLTAWQILHSAFPELVMIIAPRHLKNVLPIEDLFRTHGFSCTLWSVITSGEKRTERIVIVDEIGRLFDMYGISSVAFVGGSMAPKGGQNILEPAAWSRPVLYGPYTENFEDAARALADQGASGLVIDGKELAQRIDRVLRAPDLARKQGESCRRALVKIAARAATKQAECLVSLCSSPS